MDRLGATCRRLLSCTSLVHLKNQEEGEEEEEGEAEEVGAGGGGVYKSAQRVTTLLFF